MSRRTSRELLEAGYDDRPHEDAIQRGIDERTEAAYLLDVAMEGQAAGLRGTAAGQNPYTDIHSREYATWETARRSGEAARLARALARRAA